MAKWHDLPPEVRRLILHRFCSDLVADFTNSHVNPWETLEYTFESPESGVWPKHPESLLSFSSALQTCRYFYHTITDDIKLNRESTGVLLQREQHQVIHDIIKEQYDEPASLLVEVGFLYALAGRFWKNSSVFKAHGVLDAVLGWITPTSRMMLIPHLEEWLLYHAEPNLPKWPDQTENDVLTVGIGEDARDCPWMRLREGLLKLRGPVLSISTIDQVVPDKEADDDDNENDYPPCDPNIRVLRDIHNSNPDTWWFFPPDDFGVGPEEMQWTLVHYGLQKIYCGPEGSWGRYWEDVWDVPNWMVDGDSE
jgi:hypothetical protein